LFLVDESIDAVLLARRSGETEYDEVFSLIGGKMERDDGSLLAGLAREKNEEIGPHAAVEVLVTYSHNVLFWKIDGNAMVLPHFLARYLGGEIQLGEEYSEYRWVPLVDLAAFTPMIENIPQVGSTLVQLRTIAGNSDYVRLEA
jgi:hypothetical protein